MPDDAWLESLFKAIDSKNADEFTAFLTENCRFTFGNIPTMEGRAGIHEMVSGFFASIAAISHRIEQSWKAGDALISHGIVTYTRLNGSSLQVPFAIILTMDGAMVSDYRIFVDTSELYQ